MDIFNKKISKSEFKAVSNAIVDKLKQVHASEFHASLVIGVGLNEERAHCAIHSEGEIETLVPAFLAQCVTCKEISTDDMENIANDLIKLGNAILKERQKL